MNSVIEKLLFKINEDVKRDGRATISDEELALLTALYQEYKSLYEDFTVDHFLLLDYLNRERRATEILRFGDGPTNNRRNQALQELRICQKKILPIEGTVLLLYYANLVNGIDFFTGEKRERLSKKEAVEKIVSESGLTNQAIEKRLQRAYGRLNKMNQLPDELKGILPPNWPIV